MKNNNKDLLIEEYDSHFLYQTKKNNLNVSFNRIAFIFFVFVIISLIFSTKAIFLGSLKKNTPNKTLAESEFRSSILDRNGNIVAKTIITNNVGINPKLVIDKKKLLLNLKLIFNKKNSINFKKVEKKLNGKNFFYIKKKIGQDELDELNLLGDKSIIIEQKISRLYPHENLFSHIIGQIDDGNNGISGIEKFYDYELKKKKQPIKLTVDTDLQYLIREELIKSEELFDNIGSAALLMNLNDGEILSLISLPDFNLNKRQNIQDLKYTNKVTKGVYELGSVFKTFTLAAAFENNLVEKNTIFKNLEHSIFCAGKKISEYDKLPKNLSAEQILIRSSNIGSIRIAQKVGIEKYKDFLNSLGLFQKIDFDLEEIGTPLPFKWGKCKLATASFGHGVTTTPIQLAKAYAVLSNGGYKIKPTILFDNTNFYKENEKIISSKTSLEINSILRKVVSKKEGTANFANIQGYEVGGKTGTALKSINGIYTNKKINTFISIFPTSKPKYVLFVMLDEPKPAPDYVYEFPNGYKHKGEKRNTSGWNTVVVAGKIIKKIGPILAINNLQASK